MRLDACGHERAHASICQSTPAVVHEEGLRPSGALAAGLEVGRAGARRAGWPKSTMRSLRPFPTTRSCALLEVDGREVEAHELGAAQRPSHTAARGSPAPGSRPESSPGTASSALTSFSSSGVGMRRSRRGESDRPRGILLEYAFPAEVPEEGAQGGELARGRDLLDAPAVEVREERADHQVVDVRGPPSRPSSPWRWSAELLEVLGVGANRVRARRSSPGRGGEGRTRWPPAPRPSRWWRPLRWRGPVSEAGPETVEALQRAVGQGHAPLRLVLHPGRELGQQAEGDVRGLVVLGIAPRDVAAEGAQGRVFRKGQRFLAARPGTTRRCAARSPEAADST